jgi:protein O-GlcNAc transferase
MSLYTTSPGINSCLRIATKQGTQKHKRVPSSLQSALSDGHYKLALDPVDRLSKLGSDVAWELSIIAIGLMHQCDWHVLREVQGRLEARLQTGAACIIDTYAIMASTENTYMHLEMAKCISAAIRQSMASFRPANYDSVFVEATRQRLKVGYICGYLNNHPMSILMAGIFERHDRRNFHVFLYDNSVEDGSPLRRRVRAGVETFVDIGSDSPDKCAERIASNGIDILVDLNGYTPRARSEVLALRPAPIQVAFLGYVGTQGADWIDYVIADKHILPLTEQPAWHEKIIHLPDCYLPNDRGRPIPQQTSPAKRKALGLPNSGIVFVCFCSCYKITPTTFALWMEILESVPGSVLWLYGRHADSVANLRGSAFRLGIDPSRLIFAEPLTFDEHIHRHAYADVFLDTFPYGAHTTGADAIWAGVPLITMRGRSLSSRVGASMLVSVGLSELICDTREEYLRKSERLARDKDYLSELKQRLILARTTSPLFNAARFTVALEESYVQMSASYHTSLEMN